MHQLDQPILLIKHIVEIDLTGRRLDPHNHALRFWRAAFRPCCIEQDRFVRKPGAKRIAQIGKGDVLRLRNLQTQPSCQAVGQNPKVARFRRDNRWLRSGGVTRLGHDGLRLARQMHFTCVIICFTGMNANLFEDRPLSANFDPAPTSLENVVQPEWLTSILIRQWPGAKVERATIVETLVTQATKVRVQLELAGAGPEVPRKICIKGVLTKTDVPTTASLVETRFYRDTASQIPVRVPACIHAGLNAAEIDAALDLIRAIAERGITIMLIEHVKIGRAHV